MNEADILATTYNHKCKILRAEHSASGNFDRFDRVEVYTDIPCAVSFVKGSTQGKSDTTQEIRYAAVLFTHPDIRIKAGDEIIASVEEVEYMFLAGEGVLYPSHNETPMIRKSDA